VQKLAIGDGRNREVERVFKTKKKGTHFNLPLARNDGTTMAGSGKEGVAKARRSSGRIRRSRMVALWWMLVSEREKEREERMEVIGTRKTKKSTTGYVFFYGQAPIS